MLSIFFFMIPFAAVKYKFATVSCLCCDAHLPVTQSVAKTAFTCLPKSHFANKITVWLMLILDLIITGAFFPVVSHK